MSANKIAETSLSSGTGNFILTGAWSLPNSFISGNRTFNSFYGLAHRFQYSIQDKLGNWEKGLGYLTDNVTLVRETVIDNSLATTALIDFPVGEKLVMVPTDAGMDILPKLRVNGQYAGSGFFFNNGSNHTFVANRVALTPLLIKRPMAVSGVAISILTAAASSKVRLGLYQFIDVDAVNHSLARLFEFGELDAATTGDKELSGGLNLAAGLYFTASVSNGAPILRGQNVAMDFALSGQSSNQAIPCQGFLKTGVTGSPDALPSILACSNGDISSNGVMPRVFLKGRFL